MSCSTDGKITIQLPRGSKLMSTYPELARLNNTPLNCKALDLITGFELIDGQRLRVELDCAAGVAWLLAQNEKAPNTRCIIHIETGDDVTEEQRHAIASAFADAACGVSEIVTTQLGVKATVVEKSSGAGLEIVRLLTSLDK